MKIASLVLPFSLYFIGAHSEQKLKTSKAYGNSHGGHPKPRFISFNSEDGHIDIDWDVTIPFISIPLHKGHGENGEIAPLLNVNTKALGVAGIITAILSFVVPLLTRSIPNTHYRSTDDFYWSQMGNTVNELLFGNNLISPCVERIICSIVSMAAHSENPTSTEKIIDGLSSHRWFKDAMNGTIIQDAVKIGREGNQDCAQIYKHCLITPRLLMTMIHQFGI